MPDDTTAPVTAEGLREQIATIVTHWALMYPFANYGIWNTAGGDVRDQLTQIAENIAAGWGRDIAERVVAALAGDPRDLPAAVERHLERRVATQQATIGEQSDLIERLQVERDAAVAAVRTAQITHIRETHPNYAHVGACVGCQVLVPLSAAMPSRPDDPEEIRRLAESAGTET